VQKAEVILGIIHERGKRGLPLENVYRLLFNLELFLLAYGKIYRNKGAMTPGTTSETVDEMSLDKIETIIETLRYERYVWSPARRVYIEKKNSTKKRPLGLPTWSDKLVQEVIRLILEAYYEPQFSDRSHGFRPKRGCHTALSEIRNVWAGTSWFIEGDIKGCFDNIDHEVLLSILRADISDNRFLRLIENLLKAGYLEEWKYNATHSGTPQGGVISPLLSNIYLDRLDKFVEETLLPAYNQGGKRADNQEYKCRMEQARQMKLRGRTEEARNLRRQTQQMPSLETNDPDHRRLRYIRYADDFLLGFQGPRQEAEEIKRKLKDYLQEQLKLELSDEKTLVTHSRTQAARFLGYEIVTLQSNTKQHPNRHARSINGRIGLKVPSKVVKDKSDKFLAHGKPIHRKERTNDTDFTIVATYQSEYRGVVEYYRLAYNLRKLDTLKWIMEQSLTKTLASKLQVSVSKVYERYRTTLTIDNKTYKVLEVKVERERKKPLVAQWGGISLCWKKDAILDDQPYKVWNTRTELLERLLAEECELCGSTEDVEVHHIHALKDLTKKDRIEKPEWMKLMIARQRKTLVVCHKCHLGKKGIHPGHYDGTSTRI
jgi:group II intron reverse transcriptase/maturase